MVTNRFIAPSIDPFYPRTFVSPKKGAPRDTPCPVQKEIMDFDADSRSSGVRRCGIGKDLMII